MSFFELFVYIFFYLNIAGFAGYIIVNLYDMLVFHYTYWCTQIESMNNQLRQLNRNIERANETLSFEIGHLNANLEKQSRNVCSAIDDVNANVNKINNLVSSVGTQTKLTHWLDIIHKYSDKYSFIVNLISKKLMNLYNGPELPFPFPFTFPSPQNGTPVKSSIVTDLPKPVATQKNQTPIVGHQPNAEVPKNMYEELAKMVFPSVASKGGNQTPETDSAMPELIRNLYEEVVKVGENKDNNIADAVSGLLKSIQKLSPAEIPNINIQQLDEDSGKKSPPSYVKIEDDVEVHSD